MALLIIFLCPYNWVIIQQLKILQKILQIYKLINNLFMNFFFAEQVYKCIDSFDIVKKKNCTPHIFKLPWLLNI